MKKYSLYFLVLLNICLFVCPVYANDFSGQTLQVQWLYQDINTVWGYQNVVVSPGVEIVQFGNLPLDIDISSNQIEVLLTGDTSFSSTSFNGFLFTDINGTVDAITSVTINSSTVFPGLDASRINFDANNIWLNLQGLPTDSLHHSALFDVAFSTVPEPTTMLLLGLGLMGLAGVRRKLKR